MIAPVGGALLLGTLSVWTLVIYVAGFGSALRARQTLENRVLAQQNANTLMSVVITTSLAVPALVLGAAYGLFSHVSNNWVLYTAAAALAGPAQMASLDGPALLEFADATTTQYVFPIYNSLVLPVLNVIRVLYNIFECWLSSILFVSTEFLVTSLNLAVRCPTADWGLAANELADTVAFIFEELIRFVESEGDADLNTRPVAEAFGVLVGGLENITLCECQDLEALTSIVTSAVQNQNGVGAAFHAINAPLSLIRIFWQWLVDVVTDAPGTFLCTVYAAGSQARLECKLERAPKFQRSTAHLCELTRDTLGFADDMLQVLWDTTFELTIGSAFAPGTQFTVPPVQDLVSAPVCSILTYANTTIDVLFHPDLVFDSDLQSSYGLHVPWPQAVQDFCTNFTRGLDQFGTAIIDNVSGILSPVGGNSLAELNSTFFGAILQAQLALVRLVCDLLALLLRVVQVFLFDQREATIQNVTDLLQSTGNYPSSDAEYFTPLRTNLELFTTNVETAAELISGSVAELVENLMLYTADLVSLVLDAALHVKTGDFADWMENEFPALFDRSTVHRHRAEVSLGNIVRELTFGTGAGFGACPLQDVSTITEAPISQVLTSSSVEPLCCLASLLQNGYSLLNTLFESLVHATLDVVSGGTSTWFLLVKQNAAFANQLHTDVRGISSSLACLISSPFALIPQGCGSGTVASIFFDLSEVVMRPFLEFPTRIYRGFIFSYIGISCELGLSGLGFTTANCNSVKTSPDYFFSACDLMREMYILTVGYVADVFVAVLNIFTCIGGSGGSTPGAAAFAGFVGLVDDVWGTATPWPTVSIVRNICTLIDFFEPVFSFVNSLIEEVVALGRRKRAFLDDWRALWTALEDAMEYLFDKIGATIDLVQGLFSGDVLGFLEGLFTLVAGTAQDVAKFIGEALGLDAFKDAFIQPILNAIQSSVNGVIAVGNNVLTAVQNVINAMIKPINDVLGTFGITKISKFKFGFVFDNPVPGSGFTFPWRKRSIDYNESSGLGSLPPFYTYEERLFSWELNSTDPQALIDQHRMPPLLALSQDQWLALNWTELLHGELFQEYELYQIYQTCTAQLTLQQAVRDLQNATEHEQQLQEILTNMTMAQTLDCAQRTVLVLLSDELVYTLFFHPDWPTTFQTTDTAALLSPWLLTQTLVAQTESVIQYVFVDRFALPAQNATAAVVITHAVYTTARALFFYVADILDLLVHALFSQDLLDSFHRLLEGFRVAAQRMHTVLQQAQNSTAGTDLDPDEIQDQRRRKRELRATPLELSDEDRQIATLGQWITQKWIRPLARGYQRAVSSVQDLHKRTLTDQDNEEETGPEHPPLPPPHVRRLLQLGDLVRERLHGSRQRRYHARLRNEQRSTSGVQRDYRGVYDVLHHDQLTDLQLSTEAQRKQALYEALARRPPSWMRRRHGEHPDLLHDRLRLMAEHHYMQQPDSEYRGSLHKRCLQMTETDSGSGPLVKRASSCLNETELADPDLGLKALFGVDFMVDCDVITQSILNMVDYVCNCVDRSIADVETILPAIENEFAVSAPSWRQYSSTYARYLRRDYDLWAAQDANETHAMVPWPAVEDRRDGSFNVLDELTTLFWIPVQFVFQTDLTPYDIFQTVAQFLLNPSLLLSDGLLFYLEFFFLPDCALQKDCALNDRGLGLFYGVGVVFLVLLGAIFAVHILFNVALMSLFNIYTFLVALNAGLMVAYFWSPLCLLRGAVPNCIADDLYRGFATFGTNCFTFENYLPGIASATCGTNETDYARQSYVDWTQEPYNFNNGQRSIFFTLELISGDINPFLRTTGLPLFSWVRELPRAAQDMEWDFPPGDPTDDYTSAYLVSTPQMVPLVMGGVLALAAAALLFQLLTVLTLAGFQLVEVLTSSAGDMLLSGAAGGYTADTQSSYLARREVHPYQTKTEQHMELERIRQLSSTQPSTPLSPSGGQYASGSRPDMADMTHDHDSLPNTTESMREAARLFMQLFRRQYSAVLPSDPEAGLAARRRHQD